ncbi:MAG: lyase family protein, partial [Candidatus Aenigmarchaeota archaeon]|nr:lyase family protein [Candidatus Aenigmarchaeota archaeon]
MNKDNIPTYDELIKMIEEGQPSGALVKYARGLERLHDELEQRYEESRYENFCPIDFKYHDESLVPYLSAAAEVRYCARVQAALMDGLREFGRASEGNMRQMKEAIKKISPAKVYFLEREVTRHDQLAVIGAISEHVSEDTALRMHPGTTSYDILDTARACMYKECMKNVFLPAARLFLHSLVDIADLYADRVQIGRTHDQWTSPVTFGFVVVNYANRVAGRTKKIGDAGEELKGKISGIVGTHASIGTVVGRENARTFEEYVLKQLGLEPSRAASQVTSKEEIIDLAHYIATYDGVLADLSNSMRSLQRSEIGEVTQSDTRKRLGGSSADPSKNNPIDFENANGLWEDVISGMMTMYHLQVSDHQRDLRGSVQSRFEPVHIVCSSYDSTKRLTRVMNNLMVMPDNMERHLEAANKYSISEALNATLKHYLFLNPHETVKELSKKAMKDGRPLLDVALEKPEIQYL